MELQIQRGCGLDVHQATVVACLLTVLADGKVKKQIRAFGTTTRELLALSQWLQGEGCTHVAMESTGVYWKPVYAVLEGTFELIVANAQHIKNVPGRKTDVKDAEWIADLLLHGLLRPSFVPPKPIRELRDLTRYRRKLVESRSAERNRLLKVLETANIKLASVASDAFGVSGMQMLTALAEGKATPAELGVDMKVFPTASQLASWAGVSPGNNESAGKRRNARVTKGNFYLKTALVEAAQAATRAKGTYLRDKYYRLKARRGSKRAVVAIGHKILVAVYHMLSDQVSYNDLGDLYLDRLNKEHLTRNLVRRLERIGWRVTLEKAAA